MFQLVRANLVLLLTATLFAGAACSSGSKSAPAATPASTAAPAKPLAPAAASADTVATKASVADSRYGKVVAGSDDTVDPAVTKLNLHRINDRDLKALKPSSNVTEMVFDSCSVASIGLATLANWPNLSRVSFVRCEKLDDWALIHLKDVPKLTQVTLKKSNGFTAEGIAALREVAPSVRIVRE